MQLLLIEDDAAMQATLQRTLSRRGIHVTQVHDGSQALAAWQAAQPDAVVLDLSLPGMDGLEVLAAARGRGWATPVLILTARGTVGDRVLGLNTGADDYLAKPFDLDELEARLRALVRRARSDDSPARPDQAEAAHAGGVRYDKAAGAFYLGSELLELSPREVALLKTLMQQLGQAVTKERLFAAVFAGEADVQLEAVEVVAYRLRKKLAPTGLQLMTLRGLGYLLKVG
ncbi:MAG: response regulator [Comamonas sp.]